MSTKHSAEDDINPKPTKIAKTKQQEFDYFLSVFDQLKGEMISEIDTLQDISDAVKDDLKQYYDKCLQYTVPGGKMTRGLTVLKGCQLLLGELTDDMKFKASVLGWCIEWLQAMFLVADDVMDNSITRRGNPCWYRLPHVTVANAVNDALVLNTLIYKIVKRHFSNEKYYLEIHELLHDITFRTEMGQHLDTNSTPFDTPLDLSRFTKEKHKAIVLFKTAYYSFYLSVAFALILSNQNEAQLNEQARVVCMDLGEYFQVQDDYLDCYGDPEFIGKIGTDIEDAKCSWVVCEALERANEEQRRILQENYGKHDAEKVLKVKNVFKELDIEKSYHEYEEASKKRIDDRISKIQSVPLQKLLEFLLGKIYQRTK